MTRRRGREGPADQTWQAVPAGHAWKGPCYFFTSGLRRQGLLIQHHHHPHTDIDILVRRHDAEAIGGATNLPNLVAGTAAHDALIAPRRPWRIDVRAAAIVSAIVV